MYSTLGRKGPLTSEGAHPRVERRVGRILLNLGRVLMVGAAHFQRSSPSRRDRPGGDAELRPSGALASG